MDRAVIAHVDDLGASHGANVAYRDLAANGLVTCGSVMVPGPWFGEVADTCAGGGHDIGVHLTLTSEWRWCRWAPISTTRPASGLIDGDGYFWPDLASLARHVVPEAAEAEMRAQIERAVAAGLAPTHLDAHMAGAMLPRLLEIQVRLAQEYKVFPVLPRSIAWAPDADAYRRVLHRLDRAGVPVVDHCRGTLAVDPAALEAGWSSLLDALPPGLTHLALHPTAPGDFAAAAPDHAVWREAEYAFLRAGGLARRCAERGIAVQGLRALQARFVTNAGTATPR